MNIQKVDKVLFSSASTQRVWFHRRPQGDVIGTTTTSTGTATATAASPVSVDWY